MGNNLVRNFSGKARTNRIRSKLRKKYHARGVVEGECLKYPQYSKPEKLNAWKILSELVKFEGEHILGQSNCARKPTKIERAREEKNVTPKLLGMYWQEKNMPEETGKVT